MNEKQEWMKQIMKDVEDKVNAKLNRTQEHGNHPVTHDQPVEKKTFENNERSSVQERQGRSLKILVSSDEGDKVRINVPLKLGKWMLQKSSKFSGKWAEALDENDVAMIMAMIDEGHIGEIVNVESSDGDTVIVKID